MGLKPETIRDYVHVKRCGDFLCALKKKKHKKITLIKFVLIGHTSINSCKCHPFAEDNVTLFEYYPLFA